MNSFLGKFLLISLNKNKFLQFKINMNSTFEVGHRRFLPRQPVGYYFTYTSQFYFELGIW